MGVDVSMKEAVANPVQLLVLGSPELGDEFQQWVEAHAVVQHASSFDHALQYLKNQEIDLILCPASEFRALGGATFAGEAAVILDGVQQGVGIVSESGEFEWANHKLLSLPADIRARISRFCTETFQWAQGGSRGAGAQARGRRFSFSTPAQQHFEMSATPVIDLHQRVTRLAVVVWDTTASRRLQEKLDAIDRAGRELLSLDAEQLSRLDTQERLSLLEQKIRRCTRDYLSFDSFEVRVWNKRNNQLDLALAFGPHACQDEDMYAAPEEYGLRGYVASKGQSYICPDISKDPCCRPGTDLGRSSLTIPLFLHDKPVGVAHFTSDKLATFNEHDRQFAEIFCRYVVLALHILELLVTERQAAAGKLGSNVMAEITAPLNDLLTDLEGLTEDYIGHDDLRHRLRTISENAVRVRDTLKELTSTKPGLVGARSGGARKRDPVLEGKRVLIADDEDVIRDTVRDVLVGYGCDVATAGDGEAAIELLAKQPFDLVLSDIRMPKRSGYEVFAAAKQANAHTPVILTTGFGYDPNHSIVRARREGLAAVLFKPFKVDQLLNEIRMALKSAK